MTQNKTGSEGKTAIGVGSGTLVRNPAEALVLHAPRSEVRSQVLSRLSRIGARRRMYVLLATTSCCPSLLTEGPPFPLVCAHRKLWAGIARGELLQNFNCYNSIMAV